LLNAGRGAATLWRPAPAQPLALDLQRAPRL